MNCILEFTEWCGVDFGKIRKKHKNIWLFAKKIVLLRRILKNYSIKNKN